MRHQEARWRYQLPVKSAAAHQARCTAAVQCLLCQVACKAQEAFDSLLAGGTCGIGHLLEPKS
jgi:hypothetical protein